MHRQFFVIRMLLMLLFVLLLMKLMLLTLLLNNHHRDLLLLLQRSYITSPLNEEVDGHVPAYHHHHMRKHDTNKCIPCCEHVKRSTQQRVPSTTTSHTIPAALRASSDDHWTYRTRRDGCALRQTHRYDGSAEDGRESGEGTCKQSKSAGA